MVCATPCELARTPHAGPSPVPDRYIRRIRVSSPFARRRACIRIRTGSVFTQQNGTGSGRSAIAFHHCSVARSSNGPDATQRRFRIWSVSCAMGAGMRGAPARCCCDKGKKCSKMPGLACDPEDKVPPRPYDSTRLVTAPPVAVRPPSTTYCAPVMLPARSEHRNSTILATSSAVP